ncbi:MAG: formate/nitrite transporter family protein, partial [Lachnospiraceae bacterium]|nr:formate/nitrite transporter family protein [Lachnospiraceae bacterium]
MFQKEFTDVSRTAEAKVSFLHANLFGYFLLAMLAGMYIGFGVLLSFTVGGLLNEYAGAKLLMGLCFGVALSLVVMAGAELFTGNNFVMAAGMLRGTVEGKDAAFLWIVCYIGNLCGALL